MEGLLCLTEVICLVEDIYVACFGGIRTYQTAGPSLDDFAFVLSTSSDMTC